PKRRPRSSFRAERAKARSARKLLRGLRLDIPTNSACRAYDRVLETARSGEPNALRALLAPGLPADSIPVGQLARQLLATAGDRIAVERVTADRADSAAIHIVEVDPDGKLAALVVLDAEDSTAALLDAQE